MRERRPFTHPAIAAIVGIFAGALTIMLVETAAHALLGTASPADLQAVTVPMFASVLVAWVVGAGVAGLVGTSWNGARSPVPGTIGGVVLLAGAVLTMMTFPHPIWMMIGAVTLMPMAAWLAARSRLAKRA